MVQSDQYADQDEIAYLADLPGADPDNNWLVVHMESGKVDIVDRSSRDLGVVSLDHAVEVQNTSSNQIDPATEGTLSSLAAALNSNSNDYLIIDQNSALDVSASTVTVQENNPIAVSSDTTREIGKARVQDSSGVLVDPVDASDLSQISASTATAGSSNAAVLDLGAHRKDADIFYDVSGSATVTIEVSTDNATWRPLHSESLSAAGTDILQFETSYRYIRTYADANLNTLEVVSKGD